VDRIGLRYRRLGVGKKINIKLRKFIEKNESLKKELFDSQETPMILQLEIMDMWKL
jgi:hypothetical protein